MNEWRLKTWSKKWKYHPQEALGLVHHWMQGTLSHTNQVCHTSQVCCSRWAGDPQLKSSTAWVMGRAGKASPQNIRRPDLWLHFLPGWSRPSGPASLTGLQWEYRDQESPVKAVRGWTTCTRWCLVLESPDRGSDAHLRDGGWLPCRLNALFSCSWVILELPSSKYSFEGVVLVSVWLNPDGPSSKTLLSLGLFLWGSSWLLEVAFGFSTGSSFSWPRGLLEMESLLKVGTSCGPGQAGVWTRASDGCWLSSGAWSFLFKDEDRLRERLRKESWRGKERDRGHPQLGKLGKNTFFNSLWWSLPTRSALTPTPSFFFLHYILITIFPFPTPSCPFLPSLPSGLKPFLSLLIKHRH